MKALLQRALGRVRHHFLGMVLTGAIAATAFTAVGLGLRLGIGTRRRPDREMLDAIERTQTARTLPEASQAIRGLDELREKPMLPATRARLLIALGELHRRCAGLDPSFPAHKDHLDSADHYYRRARELSPDEALLTEVQDGQAHLHYHRHEWALAEAGFARMLRHNLSPEDRGAIEVMRCQCLVELGRAQEAYDSLGETLGRFTAGAVHDHAKLLLAEMLAGEYSRRRHAAPTPVEEAPAPQPEAAPEETSAAIEQVPTDELATQANAMLSDMLQRLPDGDERRLRVLNGLLQLCIDTGEVEKAYTYVRELEGVVGQRDQQVRSYDLLATLEEGQGNLADAEEAMLFCIREFPEHERSHQMRLRLSRLLLREGRLREGLAMLEAVLQHTKSRKWSEAVTGDMLPGSPDSVLDPIAKGEDTSWAFDTLRRLLDVVEQRTTPRDLLVRERLLFLQILLPYRAHDYAAAEAAVPAYLGNSPFSTFLDDVLAMDTECAVALRRGPAIRAVRAHRYVHTFPNGKHGEEMLAVLLRAYYHMQLYRDNLEMAEAAFVRAMVQDTETDSQKSRRPALRSVRWIAQCNSRLGRTERAMPLFQRLAQRLDDIAPDLDFFRDWANAAWSAKQWRESIRRLEVGALRTPPGRDREQLVAMALRTRFRLDPNGALPDVAKRLAELRKRGFPADETVLRPLFEILLQNALDTGGDELPGLLAKIRTELPQAEWVLPWALRFVQARLADDREEQALAKLSAIYPPGEGDGARGDRLGNCLRAIETIAKLGKQADELNERGL